MPCVPDCLSRGRCNAYCPRLQRTLQVGHVGSCASTIKRSRTLNLTTIQCCPIRCAHSASRLDTSTLKLSTCNVQIDHATKYRESQSKMFASMHADRYYAKRQHGRAFDTMSNCRMCTASISTAIHKRHACNARRDDSESTSRVGT